MNKNALAQAISGQFRRALKMFRQAVLAFPAGEWRVGDSHYLRPAGLAYHALETIDFYTSDQPADEFPWGNRFGVDWEDQRSELLPRQEDLIAYLEEVESRLAHVEEPFGELLLAIWHHRRWILRDDRDRHLALLPVLQSR